MMSCASWAEAAVVLKAATAKAAARKRRVLLLGRMLFFLGSISFTTGLRDQRHGDGFADEVLLALALDLQLVAAAKEIRRRLAGLTHQALREMKA